MRILKKFLGNEKGNVALMFGISAIPMMGIAGFSVDYYRSSESQMSLQTAVDGSLLAVASHPNANQSQLDNIVFEYLSKNINGSIMLNRSDVSVKDNDGVVTVTVNSSIKPTLTKLLGKQKLNVSANAEIKRKFNKIEVALVLDTTRSMRDPVSGSSSKLAALEDSAKKFVNKLFKSPRAKQSVKVGLVPFAQYIKVDVKDAQKSWVVLPGAYRPSSHDKASNWSGCISASAIGTPNDSLGYKTHIGPGVKYSAALDRDCSSEFTQLTNSVTDLEKKIDSLTAIDGTFIPIGLVWGYNILSNEGPYNIAQPNSELQNGLQKVIVLMTDGDNTMAQAIIKSRDGIITEINDRNRPIPATDEEMIRVCKQIKEKGVIIYTIGFGDAISDRSQNFLVKCSGNADRSFSASNSQKLSDAFSKIADSISTLHLSK